MILSIPAAEPLTPGLHEVAIKVIEKYSMDYFKYPLVVTVFYIEFSVVNCEVD